MNRVVCASLLLLGLVGCTDEQRFREDADAATCAWAEDCFGDDAETCLADAEAAWTEPDRDCDFSPRKARKCVRQLERLECPDDGAGGAMPWICDEVWTCP